MRAIFLLSLALLTTGCLRFGRLVIELDLVAKRGTLTFYDLASDATIDDRATIRDGKDLPEILAFLGMPHVTDIGHATRHATDDQAPGTDGIVTFAFARFYEVGVSSLDATYPYRYCHPTLFQPPITRTNADARDRRGCLLWKAGATKLVIEMTATRAVSPHERANVLTP